MLEVTQQKVLPRFIAIFLGILLLLSLFVLPVKAQEDKGGFSLQVTPSPLVATIKPGQATTLDLKIRNTNTKSEDLKMGLRSFSVSDATGDVNLGNDAPNDIKEFVTFENPTFTLKAGEWFTQHITIDTPASAGFSYSFAVTVSRQSSVPSTKGAAAIQGSVAVFTLLSVDRPGAVRKFEITQVKSAKWLYEYLPATFTIGFKNTGNTLVRPSGSVFVQRLSTDKKPIDALPINPAGGYILPGTSRTLTVAWDNGFPHYGAADPANPSKPTSLIWNWAHISDLQIGRYVAKVVAVYDDGQRDVPVTGEVAFWVIPWKILLGFTAILLLVIAGIVSIFRTSIKVIKRDNKSKTKTPDDEKDS